MFLYYHFPVTKSRKYDLVIDNTGAGSCDLRNFFLQMSAISKHNVLFIFMN